MRRRGRGGFPRPTRIPRPPWDPGGAGKTAPSGPPPRQGAGRAGPVLSHPYSHWLPTRAVPPPLRLLRRLPAVCPHPGLRDLRWAGFTTYALTTTTHATHVNHPHHVSLRSPSTPRNPASHGAVHAVRASRGRRRETREPTSHATLRHPRSPRLTRNPWLTPGDANASRPGWEEREEGQGGNGHAERRNHALPACVF